MYRLKAFTFFVFYDVISLKKKLNSLKGEIDLKKTFRMLSVSCLSLLMGMMMIVPASAEENNHTTLKSENSINLLIDEKATEIIEMIASLDKEIQYNQEGFIVLESSDKELMSFYNLTPTDISLVRNAISEVNFGILKSKSKIQQRAYIKDWAIYVTPNDQRAIISAYQAVGPAAVATTLAALLSVAPGAGTMVGGIVGFLGAGTIVGFMIDTALNNKTIRIGFNGISQVN